MREVHHFYQIDPAPGKKGALSRSKKKRRINVITAAEEKKKETKP